MKVETYEVEEISGELETMAADSEAIELAARMGLDGQKSLVDIKTATRLPYRLMTAHEHFVFSLLCPKRTNLKAYSDGPIPLRVLQVASHALDTGLFTDVVVWSPATPTAKDPVLVGMQGGEYESNRPTFILARWGKELDSIEKLIPVAKKAAAEKLAATYKRFQSELVTAAGSIEDTIERHFEQGHFPTPHLFLH